MKKSELQESLLHHIWKSHEQYLVTTPRLVDGSSATIISAGTFNTFRGGPDFLGAEILLDGFRIQGDIELHRHTADWSHHGHTTDSRYSSVILHVVMDNDSEYRADPDIPILELRSNLMFDEKAFWRQLFQRHYDRSPELPCFPHNLAVPMNRKHKLLHTAAELRLEELISRVASPTVQGLLDRVYEKVLDALGYSQNRQPMAALAKALPRTLLQEIRDREPLASLHQIFEALFFGVAGLLEAPNPKYPAESNEYLITLRSHWEALTVSYPIAPVLSKGDWAFFRIRPVNSPYRRVAAAASLAARYFSRENFSINEDIVLEDAEQWWALRTSYKSVLDSPYSLLGEERRAAIYLNVILPARIAFLRMQAQDRLQPFKEKDIMNEWFALSSASTASYVSIIEQELLEGEHIKTTANEQGALYLYRSYCTQLRCNECPVGKEILSKGIAINGVSS